MNIAAPATPPSVTLMPDDVTASDSETTTTFSDLLAGVPPGVQAPESAALAGFSGDAGHTPDDGERLPDLPDEFLTGLADARASAAPSAAGTTPAMPSMTAASAPALPAASTPAEPVRDAGDRLQPRTESAAAAIPAASSAENPYATQNARPADSMPGISSAPPATVPASPFTQAPAPSRPAATAEHAVIEFPIRHAEWPGAFAQRVSWTVHEKLQSAQLILNPPELGPVEIVVTVNREEASLLFVAAQPAVRNAIEQALPVLRENLQQSGIHLGNTEISSGNPQQPSEDASGQPAQDGSSRTPPTSVSSSIAADAMHRGLVDTYA